MSDTCEGLCPHTQAPQCWDSVTELLTLGGFKRCVGVALRFNGGLGRAELSVGLGDLFQPQLFWDSTLLEKCWAAKGAIRFLEVIESLRWRQAVQTFRANKTTQMLPFKPSDCRGASLTVGTTGLQIKNFYRPRSHQGFWFHFRFLFVIKLCLKKYIKSETNIWRVGHKKTVTVCTILTVKSLCAVGAQLFHWAALCTGQPNISWASSTPAQAVCGILVLFPTMGKGPLLKKFKGTVISQL